MRAGFLWCGLFDSTYAASMRTGVRVGRRMQDEMPIKPQTTTPNRKADASGTAVDDRDNVMATSLPSPVRAGVSYFRAGKYVAHRCRVSHRHTCDRGKCANYEVTQVVVYDQKRKRGSQQADIGDREGKCAAAEID